jgi:alkanesulfonate monooxygenase
MSTTVRQRTSFYWFVPVDGDSRSPGAQSPDHPSTQFEHVKRSLQAAERAGFEGALVPFSFRNLTYGPETPYIDTWTAAAALGSVTSRIRLLPAVLTGVWNPWILARAAATLDHVTGGRLDLNVITGGRDEPGVTEPVDHDTRYARTSEFIDCLRGFWSQRRFSYDGQFFRYWDMDCLPTPVQQPEIPLWFSGQSPAARQVARSKGIHTQLLVGDAPEAIGRYVRLVRDEAAEAGYELAMRFGVRLQVILGDTDDDAWATAQSMLDSFDPEIVRQRLDYLAGVDASSNARFAGQDPFDAQTHVLGPNLWSGLRLVRPGASHALVGSAESVRARLQDYVDRGIGLFVLSGYPNGEAAERFGRDVLATFDRQHAAPVGAG